MKKNCLCKKLTSLILLSALLLLTLSGCTKEDFAEGTSFAMGSALSSKVYTEDEEKAEELINLINEAVAMADKALSATDETSEISLLNKEGIIYASDFTKQVLSDSILLCNMTERKLNITMGKLTSLWGFSGDSPALPSDEDIKNELNNIDIEKILIDGDSSKVTIEDGISIDLGAFGKGAACDAVFDAVELKYTPLLVSFGGTVFVYGDGPSDGKWTIGLRDPYGDANSYFAKMQVGCFYPKNAAFVSTSGSYEKCFTQDGKTYHHILDPDTGYPVENDLISVTVIAHSGLTADALSTFAFINGLNSSTLETIGSFAAEAVFVMKDKTYYVTDGLKESLEIISEEYTLSDYDEN